MTTNRATLAPGLSPELNELWETSRPEIDARVDAIEGAAIALLESSLTPEARAAAHREAHKLAGVAGSFGFTLATELAREAEALLDSSHAISDRDVVRLSALALELRRALAHRRGAHAPQASAPDPTRTATTATGRVLIVDDDASLLALVGELLGAHGLDVRGTTEPREALALMERSTPDVLILDVDMPGMGGTEVCRAVRSDRRWDQVAIVFLTARPGATVELFDAGADNYLVKPVADDELLSVVTSRVRRTRPPSAAPSATSDVDVAIVDDDQLLVELLTHAIGSRGYSTRVITDGSTALDLLAGAQPKLRARVIVLDVGLPEHDGLAVLRALARDGITRTSRVVMLTARSLENEVLEALDLGAFDHIAKPFSVPVLMHRIRRALEDAPAVR